ncbi:MAG: type II secretion system minor pseudopilin GspI [Gammaproteobacteria bacterium]
MSRSSAGFTLLEVLVALAIVALALGAILELAGQSARTSTHLRDKTAALYVANNLSAEAELFGPPISGERRGTAQMLGHTWYWVQSTERTAEPLMVRVITRVFQQEPGLTSEGAPHVQLSSYVRRPS